MSSEPSNRTTTGEMLALATGVTNLLDSARWAIDHRNTFEPPVQQIAQVMRESIATEFLRQTPVGAVMWEDGSADSPHSNSGMANGEASLAEGMLGTPGRAALPAEDKHSATRRTASPTHDTHSISGYEARPADGTRGDVASADGTRGAAGHEASPAEGTRDLSSVGDLLFPPEDPQQARVEPLSVAPQAMERAEALYRLAVASARFNPGRAASAHPLEPVLVLALSELNRVDGLLDTLAKAYDELPSVTRELAATVERGCRKRRLGVAMTSRRSLQTAYDTMLEISRSTTFDTMQRSLAQLRTRKPADGLAAERNQRTHQLRLRGALETAAPGFIGAETGVSSALRDYVKLADLMHDAEAMLSRDATYYENRARREIDALVGEESLRYLESVPLGVLAELNGDLRGIIPNDENLSVAQILRGRELDLELQLHLDFGKVHAIKEDARRFNILAQQCVRISLPELIQSGRADALVVALGQLLQMDADPGLSKRLQGNYSSVRFRLLPLRQELLDISRREARKRAIPEPVRESLSGLWSSKWVSNLQTEVARAHEVDSLDTTEARGSFTKTKGEYLARLQSLTPGVTGSTTGVQGAIRDYVNSLGSVAHAQHLIDEGSRCREAIAPKVRELSTPAVTEFVRSCPVDLLRYTAAGKGTGDMWATGNDGSFPTIGDVLDGVSRTRAISKSVGMPKRTTIRKGTRSLVQNVSAISTVELDASGEVDQLGGFVLSLRRYLCIETPLAHLVQAHDQARAVLSGASKAMASAKEKGTSTTDALEQARRCLKAAKAPIQQLQAAAAAYQQAASKGGRTTVSSAWRAFQEDPDLYRRALLDILPCTATDADGIPHILKDFVNAATLVADAQRGLDAGGKLGLTTEAEVQRKLDTTSVDELADSVQPQRLRYLKSAGYLTVSDILHASQRQLMQVRGIGEVTASNIKSSALAFRRMLRNGTRVEPELMRLGNNSSRARQIRAGLVGRITSTKQRQAVARACDAADRSLKRVSHLLTKDRGDGFMTSEEVREIENTLAKLEGPDGPVTELLGLMDTALHAAGDVYLREP